MRRLTRRLALPLLVLSLLLAPPACKRRRKKAQTAAAQVEDGKLLSMVQAADPRASVQLVKGFYDVEQNAWRWTMGKFTVSLRPPASASQKGALLVLKFSIPATVIEQLKSMTLSASANGVALAPETFTSSGDHVYSRDVPASALRAEAVNADFALDKYLKPHGADERELGVVVSTVGFEAK